MVNGLRLYRLVLTSGHSERFTTSPNIHTFHSHVHTPTAVSATQGTTAGAPARSQGEVPRSGDASTLGRAEEEEAGDRTSNRPATSQPALPPEPHADLRTWDRSQDHGG